MTRKRILAVILAVMVVIGSLPFSVFAEEIANDEAISSGVTLEDSSGNFPVLFAQDPFNTVKSEVEGGTNYMTSVGVTRESIVRELESHEHDSFYLGTPYAGGDAQSPNGDTSYNSGTVGMNCGGFISYVLRKAGLDAETTMEIMHKTPVSQFGSGLPYDWLAGASNYKNLVENGNLTAYAFRTKQELLSSGLVEKGDIILMWWSTKPRTMRCGAVSTVTKQDSQTGSTPQGNASFAGIDFEVINRSANPVVVGGQTYAVCEMVMTITTDESGTASTGSDVLSYRIAAVLRVSGTVYPTRWSIFNSLYMDEVQFEEMAQEIEAQTLYSTGVSPVYGDHLLTLATCEYTQKNGRLAVVAVKET